jgi:hypothetical protein
MEEPDNENTGPFVAVVLLDIIYLLLLILSDIFLLQVYCPASDGFGEESRPLMILFICCGTFVQVRNFEASRDSRC